MHSSSRLKQSSSLAQLFRFKSEYCACYTGKRGFPPPPAFQEQMPPCIAEEWQKALHLVLSHSLNTPFLLIPLWPSNTIIDFDDLQEVKIQLGWFKVTLINYNLGDMHILKIHIFIDYLCPKAMKRWQIIKLKTITDRNGGRLENLLVIGWSMIHLVNIPKWIKMACESLHTKRSISLLKCTQKKIERLDEWMAELSLMSLYWLDL